MATWCAVLHAAMRRIAVLPVARVARTAYKQPCRAPYRAPNGSRARRTPFRLRSNILVIHALPFRIHRNCDQLIAATAEYVATGESQAALIPVAGLQTLRIVAVVKRNPALSRFMTVYVVCGANQGGHLPHRHADLQLRKFASRRRSADDLAFKTTVFRFHGPRARSR